VAVIRDNAACIERLLQQLQQQVAEMEYLQQGCSERVKQSWQLLKRSASQRNRQRMNRFGDYSDRRVFGR